MKEVQHPMKNPMTNEHRHNEILKAIIFGIIGFMVLLTIAMYGMEAKAAAQDKEFQERIEKIDRSRAVREAAREQECAEAREELHEYFSRQKMEEDRTKTEEFQTNDVNLQEEFDQVVRPLAIETLELKIGAGKEVPIEATEAETKKTETIMEVTEDDIIEETQAFFEELETNIGEPLFEDSEKAEIKLIEAEADFEDNWFEIQPKVDTQPEAELIPEPSVASTPVVATTTISYQENSNVNVSLQSFLEYNGMTLDDFVIRMTCMVYPEACGEAFIGKQGVAEVAMNWIYSGLKTEWWDISSEFANVPVQRYYELKYSYSETDRIVIEECEQAVRSVIDGAHPVEDLLGVKPYYFLLPEKSDPINVYVMLQAHHQIWIGNQLYLGMEGIDWTQKTN